jgi:arsenate reductase (glutaredoxin)
MSITLYGIKACDTMKKARNWLDERGIGYQFHDYKVSGIDAASLQSWCNQHGWEKVLNRAGTTFRKLDDEQKSGLDQTRAINLMLAQPSMIKRPLLDLGNDKTLLGFQAEVWAAQLN